jgi:hypothetical protein
MQARRDPYRSKDASLTQDNQVKIGQSQLRSSEHRVSHTVTALVTQASVCGYAGPVPAIFLRVLGF